MSSSLRHLAALACLSALAVTSAAPLAAAPTADIPRLVAALSGPDAAAENDARQRLVALGDAAVPALAGLAGAPGPLAPRLLAVECLGQVGTPAAMDALIAVLKTEKDLAVRGQVCMQLGAARERRAVPALAEALKAMAAGSLGDVPGPKECQPSTCFIRHVEALEMIGDDAAIPVLEGVQPLVPKIAPGGFIEAFVSEAVRQALGNLREEAAFWKAVRTRPGLEAKVSALFAHLRTLPLARLRIWEDEVIRHTEEGRRVLGRFAKHADPKVAGAARELLAIRWPGGPAAAPAEGAP